MNRTVVLRDELTRLLDGLKAVHAGRAAVIELVGDPGTGKTRLLTELADHASAHGLTVLRGTSAASRRDQPFHALQQALNGHDNSAALDRLLAPEQVRTDLARLDHARLDSTLYTPIRDLLKELAGDGLVLLLDDFHQADSASLGLIDHLLRRPVQAPLLLVSAHRPRQAPAELRSALAEFAESGSVRRVVLSALTEAQSAELLGIDPSDPALRRLHAEAEGNPFYLLMLAAAQDQGRPALQPDNPFVTRLLAELASLDPAESAVATAATILGGRFALAQLATVAELSPRRAGAAVDGLRRRDVLRLTGSHELMFRHPLLAAVIRASAELSWLSRAHRRAVGALALRGAPASELAEHIDVAEGVDPNDHTVLVQAAQDALPGDPAAAARWLRAALRRVPTDKRQHDTSLHLLIALAQILLRTEEDGAGHHVVREIRAVAQHASLEARTQAITFCASLETTLGQDVEARAMLDAAVAQTPADRPDQLAVLRCTRAIVEFLSGNAPSAADVDVALRHAREHRQAAAEATGLALRALRLVADGATTAAADVVGEAADLVDSLQDAAIIGSHLECLVVLGWTEVILMRFDDAERHLRRSLGIIRGQGHHHLQPVVLNGLAFAYQSLGRLTDATRTIAEAHCALPTGDDAQRALLLCVEWRNMLLTDQLICGSNALLSELAHTADLSSDSRWGQIAALCLADAAGLSGDPELSGSLVLAAGGGSELPDLPSSLLAPAFACLTVNALGSGANADTWMQRTASSATLPQHRGFVLLARGHMADRNGQAGTASVLLRDAAKAFCQSRLTCLQARTLLQAAAAAIRDSDHDSAAAWLVLAKQLARRSGANRIYNSADDQLRRVAKQRAAPRPEPEDNGDCLSALTDREREVADAASTGKRTREIAQQLGLSPRTVDVHLTRIYRKLGIRSRAALARMVAETR